jgi:hypothetical protein
MKLKDQRLTERAEQFMILNMAHKLGISTHVEQLKSDPSLPAPLLLPRTAPLQSMTWVRAATVILRREPASVVYSSDQYEPKTHWNVNSE